MDLKRTDTLDIQASIGDFEATFSVLTDGLLRGLDWSNIFVAGGMPLSALLCTDAPKDAEKYANSDIDLYIYGLDPVEANSKVEHIYDVWLSNLPDASAGHVLRNSRTITYVYSS